MGRVRVSILVPALASEAEELWYDTTRWATFIDGLHHIARLEGDWPRAGARVLWDSSPGGRGRVQERVTAYAAREGQTVARGPAVHPSPAARVAAAHAAALPHRGGS